MSPTEGRSLRNDLSAVFAAVGRARRRQLALAAVLMVVGAVAEVAFVVGVIPFLSLLSGQSSSAGLAAKVPDVLPALGARTHGQQIVYAALLFMLLAVVAGASRLALTSISQRWAFGTGHDIAVEIERRILSQPYAFHLDRNSSTLLAAIEKVHVLSLNVLLQLTYAATAFLAVLLIVAALVRIDPVSAFLAALGFGLVYLLVSRVAAGRLHRNSEAVARAYEERLKIVQESLGGIRDVIIDGSQQVHVEAFARADRRFVDASRSTTFIGSAPRFVIEAAASIVIAILALLLWQRFGSFPAALPIVGAMALGGFRLLPYLQQLYFSWTVVAGHRATISDVAATLTLPVDELPGGTAPTPLPLKTGLRFENVSFRYASASRPAIADLSLYIPQGAKVALVGRNGSGKTTLADLAMGLLLPTKGRILIDDVALAPDNLRGWRRMIAHVPQSIFLADTSIARNIAFGLADAEIDMARVEEAARLAQLDDFLRDLPNGLDTWIGERGIRLSGGQRQRLGLARALYKDTPVLVLDEATSALDPETEAALLRALFGESSRERTVIVISHRGGIVDQCDQVFRLEGGRLVDGVRPFDVQSAHAASLER